MKDIIILKKNLALYRKKNKHLDRIISILNEFGITYYIIGGAIRSLTKDKKPRDIDIIIDGSDIFLNYILSKNNFIFYKNSFGGYKLIYDIDIWSIEKHFMFKEKIYSKSIENILYTTFNSYDSILYDKSNNILYEDFFKRTDSTKIIEPVGNDNALSKNPNIYLSIIKLFKLELENGYKLSSSMLDIIFYYLNNNNENNTIESIYNIIFDTYCKHYNEYPKNNIISFIFDKIQKMLS